VNAPELRYKFVDLQIRQPGVQNHGLGRRRLETGQGFRAASGFAHLPSQIRKGASHSLAE
jgi:hypothetical protein